MHSPKTEIDPVVGLIKSNKIRINKFTPAPFGPKYPKISPPPSEDLIPNAKYNQDLLIFLQ